MSERRGNDSAVWGPQTPGPQGGSPNNAPLAELYEEYEEYEYNVSFEGLSANKYSIVIGFWIGLAAFIVFLFTALALMVNMTNRSGLRGAGCELSHERRRWHRRSGGSSSSSASRGGAAHLVLNEGGPDYVAGVQDPEQGDPEQGDPEQGDPGAGDFPQPRSPVAAPPRAPPRRPGGSAPPPNRGPRVGRDGLGLEQGARGVLRVPDPPRGGPASAVAPRRLSRRGPPR
uniref:Collagen alpha-4(IV) chain-like n=1 Tax=Petromyzon marinus TaxID=7757 RepID=A0AAJ7UAE0_PETMA|nr:collagen alpha-4(IV) chain-like [Petromyzon marinus]